MDANDYAAFRQILKRTMAVYDKTLSNEMADVWFDALADVSVEAFAHALTAHVRNPDTGQFPPKPADVIKAITGGIDAVCQLAWTKVAGAVGSVGPWQSVAFDDPLIHRVIDDMGGWPAMCGHGEKEWPFTQKEFMQRYRAIQTRQVPVDHAPYLIGLSEASNARRGVELPERLSRLSLVGDKQRAQAVMASGSFKPAVTVERLAHERQDAGHESAGIGQEAGRGSRALSLPDFRVRS